MSTSATRLASVDEHLSTVLGLVGNTPVERIPVADCLGLAIAEDLRSPVALPPFDNSAMDGYAVRARDIRDAPVELPVTDDIPAGKTELTDLAPGTAQRIMTGAPVPPGADAVVQVELTDGGVERVLVHGEVEPGAHIRRAGEDVRVGDVVLRAGAELGPAQLGLAAAVGAGELPVRRRPRVLVLSTGSELVAPGNPLLPGQIYESNGVMLAAAIRSAGALAEVLSFVPDDVEAFHRALEDRLESADLIVTSGGVSAGAYEVVKDAFTGNGVEFRKVAMQPGMPQGAGKYRGVPVVTLPGNPVSAQVSFEVFLRPALRSAMGHAVIQRPTRSAVITEALRSPSGRRQFRRGLLDPAAGTVELVGGPGSHLLSALAVANCLVVVPEGVSEVAAGEAVTVVGLDA
ncbi:molybdopterin molybdotransferase [Kutzneria kofuensis]|uniref:Molybdopterin molybdenumtransferase n=1 Tax=Kutzneria kofuensis TaxID=103725 RepID=A0A7W9KGI0_9PSEU|nr:molybdopterin molybdotransferase [Kutzneria kofuensis]